MVYLGIDYGQKKLGVASGYQSGDFISTTPLCTLSVHRGVPDWCALSALMETWKPVGLIVGIPHHGNGTRTGSANHALHFCEQAKVRFSLPVHTCNEHLSTYDAREQMVRARTAGARKKERRGDDDKIAAALILQDWLQTVSRQPHENI